MLYLDRRRALGGMLWIAVAAGLFLYLHSVIFFLMDDTGDAMMIFQMSVTLGFVAPVMPLVAALPFGAGFCQDHQAGYTGMALQRAGKERYLRSKGIACALSGGLASMLAMLAFIVILYARYPADLSVQSGFYAPEDLHSVLAGGGIHTYAAFFLIRLALVFLSGAFWAMTAMCFSAFYPSVPMALVMPLVLFRLLLEISGLTAMPVWLDVTLLDDGSAALGPVQALLCAVALYGGLSAALFALFRFRLMRRLNYV